MINKLLRIMYVLIALIIFLTVVYLFNKGRNYLKDYRIDSWTDIFKIFEKKEDVEPEINEEDTSIIIEVTDSAKEESFVTDNEIFSDSIIDTEGDKAVISIPEQSDDSDEDLYEDENTIVLPAISIR